MTESNANSNSTANSNSATCGNEGRPKKRTRVISSLTEEQLQHKRNVDRKAQRAFRQRSKDSIDRLEQQIAAIIQSATESEARFQHELAAVRETNNTLQQCLGQISELASATVRSISSSNYNIGNTDSNTNNSNTSNTSNTNTNSNIQDARVDSHVSPPSVAANPHHDAASSSTPPRNAALDLSYLITPIASEHDTGVACANTATARGEAQRSPGVLPVGTPSTHARQASTQSNHFPQQQSPLPQNHNPLAEPVSSLYDHNEASQHISPTSLVSAGAGYPSPSASHQFATVDPDLSGRNHSDAHLTQNANDDLCDPVTISPHGSEVAPSVSTAYSVRSSPVFTVLPSHVLPTCPLDEILHNFMITQRDLITQGVDFHTAVGPSKPTVKALLDPSKTSSVHPLCGIMSEVLSTFAHVDQPEKLAFYYLMYKTMRWQIAPSKESYMAMPTWLRPTVTQITVQHAAWIDNIPWPGVRDILIENPDDHPFDIFSQYYSHNVSVNWHFDLLDAVTDIDNEVMLHSIFEKHVSNLKNWTVSSDFQARFPYMSSSIYSRD